MKHIRAISVCPLSKNLDTANCGECRSSCQSACKTSCTVGNQKCESENTRNPVVKAID
jgi:predicted ribosomally synthesized six-cysteine peptide SCIFF